jgi:uncharacterized protein (TIGR03118 family)
MIGRLKLTALGVAALVPLALAIPATSASAGVHSYTQTNLVSDQPGMAKITDPNLVNAWGLSNAPTSPLWVSDNGADVTTLYSAADGATPAIVPLVVSIPGGAPTGQVFNSTAQFALPGGNPALFIFAGENGQISAWNKDQGTTAVLEASKKNAVYKGLAIQPFANFPRLLAANFNSGHINVYGKAFHPVNLGPSAFWDPSLPKGYAPFNVAVDGNRVFVSYAKQDSAKHDDVAGTGHGFIDVYTADGMLISHFAKRGVLNSPWGLTIAPAGFGKFAGDLLVGNFGDGRIHAYNPWTGHLVGTLRDASGAPIWIDGLWGLMPGNGTSAPADQVWFTAGPGGEAHGLLGLLSAN